MTGLAFFLLALVVPGISLQRVLRLRVDPALVLPAGTAAVAVAQALGLATGWLLLTPLLLLLLDLGLLLRRGLPRADGPSLLPSVGAALALGGLLAVPQFGWSRLDPLGRFLLDPLVPSDTAFHVGLARELTFAWPPQVPGIAGLPLSYHLGTDLVRAAALAWGGLDPYDLIARIEPVVGALALALVMSALAHRLWPGTLAAALAPWTLFLGDLSWVLRPDPATTWWCDLLRGNLLVSLAVANPVVPGLVLLGGVLLALDRHLEGEGPGHLALAAALAAVLPHFKVFLGAHLLLGLGVAALRLPRARWPALAVVMVPAAVSTAALTLGAGGAVAVTVAPGDLVRMTGEALGLAPPGPGTLAAWTAGWLLLSVGARVVGIPLALRSLGARPLAVTLGTLALSGWPLGLLFRVAAPETLPGQLPVNDAAYLVEQSGPLLWLFAIAAVTGGSSRARRALAVGMIALVSLPSTAQFVARRVASDPDPIPAPMVRAVRALEAASRPGDIVLQRPGARFPPLPVILAGRRVAFERFTPWLTQFAPRAVLDQRHEAVYRFFKTPDPAEARAIASGLGARFICLYGSDRVRFDPAGVFDQPPVHAEEGASCFRLSDAMR